MRCSIFKIAIISYEASFGIKKIAATPDKF